MSARSGITVLFLIVVIVVAGAGCATAPGVVRGTVISRSVGSQVIVRGPATLHAYAGFSGGEIYASRAAARPDADCARSLQRGLSTPVPADRIIRVTVPAGEVACLQTQIDTPYELLWHATPELNGPARLSAATETHVYR